MDSQRHGGNLDQVARKLGCRPQDIIDASSSIAPFGLPWRASIARASISLKHYPERSSEALRSVLSAIHNVDKSFLLPGNGAAELLTWAARDAASHGLSILFQPCFSDYLRALRCWGGESSPVKLPLYWSAFEFPEPCLTSGSALWITNPHNPTGQLWSRRDLEPLLQRFRLVICDEAFLPLVPEGEHQSLIPLVDHFPNLIVIRSLTKLYGIAGLRLGYAVARPDRLERWSAWRDPWPINSVAVAVALALLRNPKRYFLHCHKVQRWTAQQGQWLRTQLLAIPGLTPMPSAANFMLIRGDRTFAPLLDSLERRHRILLRDCRSFEGLDERWLRLGYQTRRRNRRIVSAIRQEWR